MSLDKILLESEELSIWLHQLVHLESIQNVNTFQFICLDVSN